MIALDFDFDAAMRQVRELRRIADEIAAANNSKLGAASDCIERKWKGPTAQQFLEKCTDLKHRVAREAASIRSLADDYERAARIIEKAEREAEAAAANA